MFSRKIKIVSFTLVLALGTFGVVNGFNESETKTVTKECASKDAAKCDKSAANAETKACANKAEANAGSKSGSCCKTAAAKACATEAEKKCSKSAGNTKTTI